MRYSLSAGHYAHDWYSQEALTPEQITDLGIRYHSLADGPERESIMLRVLQSFHNYIVKYVDMIRRGHLPLYRNHINKDSVVLLSYFIPNHEPPTRENLQRVCRTLHLAFLKQTYDEVYNIIAGMILRAIHNYDPEYTSKIRQIVAAIGRSIDIGGKQVFSAKDLNLPFDAEKPLRWLAKRGILETIKETGVKDPLVIGFRVLTWPPKKSITEAAPIGLAYHIQRQFRFYLQGYISEQIRQTEAHHQGGLQLEHRGLYTGRPEERGSSVTSHNGRNLIVGMMGRKYGADFTMSSAQLDVGTMNKAWVARTADPLFKDLDVFQRRLLYYYYARGMSWKQIAKTCHKSAATVKRVYEDTIAALQQKAAVPLAA